VTEQAGPALHGSVSAVIGGQTLAARCSFASDHVIEPIENFRRPCGSGVRWWTRRRDDRDVGTGQHPAELSTSRGRPLEPANEKAGKAAAFRVQAVSRKAQGDWLGSTSPRVTSTELGHLRLAGATILDELRPGAGDEAAEKIARRPARRSWRVFRASLTALRGTLDRYA